MSKKSSKETLTYFIPNHGQTKTSLRIPESYTLFVCPSACGRRHAIRAIKNGEKEQISFLYITEADVVSGQYEEIVGDAVHDLLTVQEFSIKAFIIYVNCIDDFLGTDEQALLQQLGDRFPALCFRVCHINPVAMDERIMPGMRMHDQLYSFLQYSGKKDDGINFIGNFISIDQDCELFEVLSGWGIHHVRQIFECKTFNEFQQMADSRLDLVLMPMGVLAGQNMVKRLDIPCFYNPISYDIDEIVCNYQSIADLLGQECPDFQTEINRTLLSIKETLGHIGNMPVIVDSSATMRPFALARALYEYGFNVQAVFALHIKNADIEERDWLAENCPHIQIVRTGSYETILGYGFAKECLTIGFDSAYLLTARHMVDIQHDESFFGFYGIQKLLRLMREASDRETNW